MKEKIREIMWDFVAGEVTDSEAVQQVLDLFAVAGRSEQLKAFLSMKQKDCSNRQKLLDDFAKAAMHGMLTTPERLPDPSGERLAKTAYFYATAMMQERERRISNAGS